MSSVDTTPSVKQTELRVKNLADAAPSSGESAAEIEAREITQQLDVIAQIFDAATDIEDATFVAGSDQEKSVARTRQLTKDLTSQLAQTLNIEAEFDPLLDIMAQARAKEISEAAQAVTAFKKVKSVVDNVLNLYTTILHKAVKYKAKAQEIIAQKERAATYVAFFNTAFAKLNLIMFSGRNDEASYLRMMPVKVTYALLSVPGNFFFKDAESVKKTMSRRFFPERIDRDNQLKELPLGGHHEIFPMAPALRIAFDSYTQNPEVFKKFLAMMPQDGLDNPDIKAPQIQKAIKTAFCIDGVIKQMQGSDSLHTRDVFQLKNKKGEKSSNKKIVVQEQGSFYSVDIDLEKPPSVLHLFSMLMNVQHLSGSVDKPDPLYSAALKRALYQMSPGERPLELQQIFGNPAKREIALLVSTTTASAEDTTTDDDLMQELLDPKSLIGTGGNAAPVQLTLQFANDPENGASLQRSAFSCAHEPVYGKDAERMGQYLSRYLHHVASDEVALSTQNSSAANPTALPFPDESMLPSELASWLKDRKQLGEDVPIVPAEFVSSIQIDQSGYAEISKCIGQMIGNNKNFVIDTDPNKKENYVIRKRKEVVGPDGKTRPDEPKQFGGSVDNFMALAQLLAGRLDGSVTQVLSADSEENLLVNPLSIRNNDPDMKKFRLMLHNFFGGENGKSILSGQNWNDKSNELDRYLETIQTDHAPVLKLLLLSLLAHRVARGGESFMVLSVLARYGAVEKGLGGFSKHILRMAEEELFNGSAGMASCLATGKQSPDEIRAISDLKTVQTKFSDYLSTHESFQPPMSSNEKSPTALNMEENAKYYGGLYFVTAMSDKFMPQSRKKLDVTNVQLDDDNFGHSGVTGISDRWVNGQPENVITQKYAFEHLIPDVISTFAEQNKFNKTQLTMLSKICLELAVGQDLPKKSGKLPDLVIDLVKSINFSNPELNYTPADLFKQITDYAHETVKKKSRILEGTIMIMTKLLGNATLEGFGQPADQLATPKSPTSA